MKDREAENIARIAAERGLQSGISQAQPGAVRPVRAWDRGFRARGGRVGSGRIDMFKRFLAGCTTTILFLENWLG